MSKKESKKNVEKLKIFLAKQSNDINKNEKNKGVNKPSTNLKYYDA
jgi:hypothetical protein